MDEEQLIKFLQERLRIDIDRDYDRGKHKVKLYLTGTIDNQYHDIVICETSFYEQLGYSDEGDLS